MKLQATIQKWVNSLAIRITRLIKLIPHFTANMLIEIEMSEKGSIIQSIVAAKKKSLIFNESQLLKDLNANNAHADGLAHGKIERLNL